MTTSKRLFVLCFALLFVCSPAWADIDFAINLQTRIFKPAKTILSQKSISAFKDKHVLVQFTRPITDADKDYLYSQGIDILEYVPDMAYTAKISGDINQKILDENDIYYINTIDPSDKISPMITEMGIGDWARRAGDLVQFIIVFHEDENIYQWGEKLKTDYDAEIIGYEPTTNVVELILPEPAYQTLAGFDEVLWIEQQAPPQEEHNNSARDNNGAQTVQQAPYNLTGSGITVAEWDGGLADAFHTDFGNRISYGNSASVGTHATHVAGTVMGSGDLSSGTYKGMAPSAKLVSFLWWGSSGTINTEYGYAINTKKARISTNSWGLGVGDPATESACQSTLGNYYTQCGTLDNTVRGEINAPITICWSAGNQRSTGSSYCGSLGWTYGTIGVYGTAKNLITVGAINSNNSSMTGFSSWGPCDDGRLKPDVVGPGCQSNGDYGVTSCVPDDAYGVMCGTSMSTPATAGVAALLLQQFDIHFPNSTILPSTLKGIMINAAEDLGNEGPDYAYGHGRVDAITAADKIAVGEPSYLENEISTGIVHSFDMTITNAPMLRVTLVWDDPGGTSISGKALINDLDLTLIDPFSNEVSPLVLNPGNPSAVAAPGVDRTNNVESVQIMNPTPGLWKARVTGYNIPEGPQKYSLVFTPDSSYTPGNLNALAIFPDTEIVEQPGTTAPVNFWVVNVGSAYDSITVSISDNNSWLNETVTDSILVLQPYDSALFQLMATIPASSLAGEYDSVTCFAASLIFSAVEIQSSTKVTAGAYYNLTVETIAEDSVSSPSTNQHSYTLINNGNSTDAVTVQITNDGGWTINPSYKTISLPPLSDSTLSFLVTVPAEVPHLYANNIYISGNSSGGSADTGIIVLTVLNAIQPPALVAPAIGTYTQERLLTFEWSGVGDTYTLYLASDQLITNIIQLYSGLTSSSYTMPSGDDLTDGEYYWGVRKYVGSDSSSLQASPGNFVIDNIAPNALQQLSPINDVYVRFKIISFNFSFANKAPDVATAPEFNILQLASDIDFTSDLLTYQPITSFGYTLRDTIPEGRWYWRLQRADSAGNVSGLSATASFILDSEKPPVPVQVSPADASEPKGNVVFSWERGAPVPPYLISPEYYRFQLYKNGATLVKDTTLYATSFTVNDNILENGIYYIWRVLAMDEAGNTSSYQSQPFDFTYINFICGDINGDTSNPPTISDLTFLVDYLFSSGIAPDPIQSGSVNCDGEVGISDITWFVDYLFNSGPPPCCE